MPKVDRNARQQPLKEVGPVPMEADDAAAAPLPDKPKFAALSGDKQAGGDAKVEFRRVPVPQHRMTPLKTAWMELYKPITENLKLDMRMNLKTKKVEIKTTPQTTSTDGLQKAADFVHAYLLGRWGPGGHMCLGRQSGLAVGAPPSDSIGRLSSPAGAVGP
ncbi:RNA-binding protein PNO1 [Tetrabaena socialis]|uniref:RNA-binding protein PNO1 n=1 Tax=Tetrabaena socialis TaxID=47790 RepID=A0A2J8AEL8_9CHLO|nr:RNA-binding protein PNO1 [Tetrabaena socialis]|eukprot:PNH10952.1 RNA-binding protein PNO1 [Tetrabaena socialis]